MATDSAPGVDPSEAGRAFAAIAAAARAVRDTCQPHEALVAVAESAHALIPSRMLTFLRFDPDRGDMVRLFCSRPDRYPIGARKAMRGGPWSARLIDRGEPFLAADAQAVRATFADHAALADLGIESVLCVPVRLAGRTLGSMNFSGDAGQYQERTAALALPFATLAVGPFLAVA